MYNLQHIFMHQTKYRNPCLSTLNIRWLLLKPVWGFFSAFILEHCFRWIAFQSSEIKCRFIESTGDGLYSYLSKIQIKFPDAAHHSQYCCIICITQCTSIILLLRAKCFHSHEQQLLKMTWHGVTLQIQKKFLAIYSLQYTWLRDGENQCLHL